MNCYKREPFEIDVPNHTYIDQFNAVPIFETY